MGEKLVFDGCFFYTQCFAKEVKKCRRSLNFLLIFNKYAVKNGFKTIKDIPPASKQMSLCCKMKTSQKYANAEEQKNNVRLGVGLNLLHSCS